MVRFDDMHRLVWDYHRAVKRRREQRLFEFAYALDLWIDGLFRGRFPPDWRKQYRAVLAEQAARGLRAVPHTADALESWLHDWAATWGLLPEQPLMEHYPRWWASQRYGTVVQLAAAPGHQTTEHLPGGGFLIHQTPNVGGPPELIVDPSTKPELAGDGPETTESFRKKVRGLLGLLDPRIAAWWNSQRGILRARDAPSWFKFLRRNYYSDREGNRPIVYVDRNFTAAEAASAIISEANKKATRAEESYFRWKSSIGDPADEWTTERKETLALGAQQAAFLAELYLSVPRALSTGADVVVTVSEIADEGFDWRQLFTLLPFVGVAGKGLGSITVRIIGQGSKGSRQFKLSMALAEKLGKLDAKARKAILAEARAAKTENEALAIIERGVRGAGRVARTKPRFPLPVDAVRVSPQHANRPPHPSHLKAAQSEEAFARHLHFNVPDEVVLLWGKRQGTHGPDIISYNLETKVVTLWDDKFRSATVRVQPSRTFAKGKPPLAASVEEAERAIRASGLSPADKAAALRSITNKTYRTITNPSGKALEPTSGGHK